MKLIKIDSDPDCTYFAPHFNPGVFSVKIHSCRKDIIRAIISQLLFFQQKFYPSEIAQQSFVHASSQKFHWGTAYYEGVDPVDSAVNGFLVAYSPEYHKYVLGPGDTVTNYILTGYIDPDLCKVWCFETSSWVRPLDKDNWWS
jgi:hypothetical protein